MHLIKKRWELAYPCVRHKIFNNGFLLIKLSFQRIGIILTNEQETCKCVINKHSQVTSIVSTISIILNSPQRIYAVLELPVQDPHLLSPRQIELCGT